MLVAGLRFVRCSVFCFLVRLLQVSYNASRTSPPKKFTAISLFCALVLNDKEVIEEQLSVTAVGVEAPPLMVTRL
jgi:hypothetical protein